MKAALKGVEGFRLPSDIAANVAAKAFADAPQPLNFSVARPGKVDRATVAAAAEATIKPTVSRGKLIGVVTEFSGIGALEHGLQDFAVVAQTIRLCKDRCETPLGPLLVSDR